MLALSVSVVFIELADEAITSSLELFVVDDLWNNSMIDKRRGWVRLGIVLSILWIVCWSLAGVINAGRFNLNSANAVDSELTSCMHALTRRQSIDGSADACRAQWRTSFIMKPRKSLLEEAGKFALISSIFIPFLWLGGFAAIFATRWVRDGFR